MASRARVTTCSIVRPAAGRRRLDPNPAVDQADQRAGKGLLQPRPIEPGRCGALSAAPLRGPAPPATPRPCRVLPAPHDRIDRSRAATAAAGFPPACRQRPAVERPWRQTPTACFAIPQRQIALGAVDQNFHRRIGPGQPRRQPRQIAAIAALGGKNRHHRAEARPGEIQMSRLVGSSAKPTLAFLRVATQLRFRNMQKRARQQHAVALGLPRHRRQSGDAAAAQHPHQQRLGLIVAGMRGKDMRRAVGPRGLRQQTVSRRPRRGRQSGFRLGAGPAQRAMRQFEAARETLDVACLGAASARKP